VPAVIRNLRRAIKQQLSFWRRRVVRPRLPVNADGKVLIHIGCGKKNLKGFVNVDAQPWAHIHVVTDQIRSLPDFADSSADLIYVCHVLEHFRRGELKDVLREMYRVLKPGGVLRVSVPDFDKLVAVYESADRDIEAIFAPLLGGQDHNYNVHYLVFNRKLLTAELKAAGFWFVRDWTPGECEHYEVPDRASKRMAINGVPELISLNLEAVKAVPADCERGGPKA